jgi:hypothetical protein
MVIPPHQQDPVARGPISEAEKIGLKPPQRDAVLASTNMTFDDVAAARPPRKLGRRK